MSEQVGAALGEDARALLAERAAGSARANTPRYLLVGAGGLLLLGGALLLGATWLRAGSASRLEQERLQTVAIRQAVAEMVALQEQEAAERASKLYDEDLTKFQKIVNHAEPMGFASLLSATQAFDQRTAGQPFRKQLITVTVQQPVTPDLLVSWIAEVVTKEAGVELSRLELTPAKATFDGAPRWTGTVVFSRWERRSS
jgi:uncharacterized protein YdhG (YjbR/CyaY superfamily)